MMLSNLKKIFVGLILGCFRFGLLLEAELYFENSCIYIFLSISAPPTHMFDANLIIILYFSVIIIKRFKVCQTAI